MCFFESVWLGAKKMISRIPMNSADQKLTDECLPGSMIYPTAPCVLAVVFSVLLSAPGLLAVVACVEVVVR